MPTKADLLPWASKVLGVETGDTSVNFGQCVGLVEKWLDFLGLPHIPGNAKDLLAGAKMKPYRVVVNTPNNAPSPGDIVVWGATWGGGYGHTAVVLAANANKLAVLEQNDPAGTAPLTGTHDYSGVLGWITW